MARIVKLSALLPEDIQIDMPGGQSFTLPGDPPLHLVMKVASLFERSANAADGEETEGVGLEVLTELDEQMLLLLRMRDPSIEQSPFGVFAVQHVVAQVLAAYNFGPAEETDENPTTPPAKKTAVKSKRSSG